MTSDPHNGYRISGRPWTPEEDIALREGIDAGRSHSVIAAMLRRTTHGVKSRIRDLKRSSEERNALRRLKRLAQPKTIRAKIEHGDRAPAVPDCVLEDRIKRAMTPRTLTGILLGDPVPGYSALDRRT